MNNFNSNIDINGFYEEDSWYYESEFSKEEYEAAFGYTDPDFYAD